MILDISSSLKSFSSVPYVCLHSSHCVSHLIVSLYIIGSQYIHRFLVLREGLCLGWVDRPLAVETTRTCAAYEPDKSMVEQVL